MENKAKILVIEDNPVNLELFMDVLEMEGYKCLSAAKGEDAIEIAGKENPDLVLLDIQLPGMDGMTVERALRANNDTKHLKIIALTAHAMKGDKEMFLREGFDGYIAKPIKIKEFIEEIKGYIK
jgi:CheY-like chemotaxis protein